jgi:hypothetical protein
MHFLNDRMHRLVTAGLLPERAGQPVKAWVHISLADRWRTPRAIRRWPT